MTSKLYHRKESVVKKEDEPQGDYVADAIEMMGKGYDYPSIVVEPPHRRIERHGKQMLEVEDAAFVKFSTEFKTELADLDVYALKVFIYIGLSINFETGTAYPGVRKIAQETKMNKDTVAKAIEELEEKGFLRVQRRDGASNIYKPECYFAIGETVPSGRTPAELSDAGAELSDETVQLSDASRVKDAQPDKQEIKQELIKEPFELFKNHFGKFLSEKELRRWGVLYEAAGKVCANELIAWAFKKEIHLMNRGGLLDSLETAAKNWGDKQNTNNRTPVTNIKRGGNLPTFDENGRVVYA
jgi:hypothetical protein